MDNKTDNLFSEFPPVSTEEWEKVIEKDLKGANYKEKLNWETGEGIEALPFYRQKDIEDLTYGPLDAEKNDWIICQPIFEQNPEQTNKTALQALEQGADALQFSLQVHYTDGLLGGDLEGVDIQSQQNFSTLLENIPLENTPLYFDSGLASPVLIAMIWNEVNARNLNRHDIQVHFSYDPFIYVMHRGRFHNSMSRIQNDIDQIAKFTLQNFSSVRPFGIIARAFHNSGATIVQELGYAMGIASEYLTVLTNHDHDIYEAASLLNFNFSIGSNYFLEIAKFRAARILWKNLIEAYGGKPDKARAYLHGETSQWNKTLYDPYSNILRTTTEGMSAAVAGCDAVTVLPFDQHFRKPDDFSQRIARNSQIIMKEESFFNKVADPAAGSYYVEKLTNLIGQEAWQLFQEVEQEGGILKAIENGTVQSAIEESQEKRNQAIASRGRIFVGTNQYPNSNEKMAEKLESKYKTASLDEAEDNYTIKADTLIESLSKALENGAKLGDFIPTLFDLGKHNIRTVMPYRGTEPFEELRLATENHDRIPKVLTLPLGNKKMRKARSTFTSNFFGCVGYQIEDPIGFESVDDAVTAIKENKPEIVVLCSSDEEYEQLVPELCDTFNLQDDKPIVVLAGYPKEHIEEYKNAGIDEFIHAKCNVLKTLKNFQHKLGIL